MTDGDGGAPRSRRAPAVRLTAGVLVFLASALYFTAESHRLPLQVDEPRMLNRGFMAPALYGQYLRTGTRHPHWESLAWQPRKPPLGNLLVSLGFWLRGAWPPGLYAYDIRYDPEWNAARGNLPAPAVLAAGRTFVPLFGAAATALVYAVTTAVAGLAGGLFAAGAFAASPVIHDYAGRALADIPTLAFALWGLWYLAGPAAAGWDGPRVLLLRRAAVLGLLTGLATATKQNGALVGCAAVAAFAVWGIGRGRTGLARALAATAVLGAVASGLYVGVNPALHRAPVARTLTQVDEWDETFAAHARRRPDQALPTLAARARATLRVVAGLDHPLLPVPFVAALLALAGVAGLLARSRRRRPATVLLLWAAVTLAAALLWTPLHWDRYYLPLLAAEAMLAGAGLTTLWRAMFTGRAP